MSKKQLLKQDVSNIPFRKGTPKFKAEGAHALNLKLWGPPFSKAFWIIAFCLSMLGHPFGPLFWRRCFASVGRLCPKPQFMWPPFLHTCLVICAFLYSISGPPFSPLFLMCFGSVGHARPKPQFMGPPFYKHVWRFLPFQSGAPLLLVPWRAAKASSRQTSQKSKIFSAQKGGDFNTKKCSF